MLCKMCFNIDVSFIESWHSLTNLGKCICICISDYLRSVKKLACSFRKTTDDNKYLPPNGPFTNYVFTLIFPLKYLKSLRIKCYSNRINFISCISWIFFRYRKARISWLFHYTLKISVDVHFLFFFFCYWFIKYFTCGWFWMYLFLKSGSYILTFYKHGRETIYKCVCLCTWISTEPFGLLVNS